MSRLIGRQTGRTAKVLWLVAFVVWVCVIWGHSLMPAPVSNSESDSAVVLLTPLFNALGITDSGVATHIVRKTAHFSEYALLGFINLGMMRAWATDAAWAYRLAVIPWLVIPCIDETIQLFVPGRDGRITDILIDLSGGLLGILIMHLLLRRSDETHV